MKQLRLTLSKISRHPNDMVVFELESPTRLSFIPGQFISLEFVINGKTERRSYSLCNSPYTDDPLTIAVKRVDNGAVSRLLHDQAVVGQELIAYEPAGLFQYHYQTETPRDIVLIGAGSGITPLKSILQSALLKEPRSTVTLVYSNHSPETTLFYDELQQLQREYPQQLQTVFLWSNHKNLSFARLNRELLEKLMAQYLKHGKQKAIIYNCGPADYMLMTKIVLTGMGFTAEQQRKETFTLPEDEADEDDGTLANQQPVDTTTYTVNLSYENKQYTLDIPYTQTILDVALENKIDLPYSCKAGMCGTCAALCTGGNVRMQYNEVLTDRETANGRVLLCTAHPLGDGVEVVVGE
jgi:ring-1,2-phenylacetyl-CoA epoxidase subunit PaaE